MDIDLRVENHGSIFLLIPSRRMPSGSVGSWSSTATWPTSSTARLRTGWWCGDAPHPSPARGREPLLRGLCAASVRERLSRERAHAALPAGDLPALQDP